jgi:hypothetical protein
MKLSEKINPVDGNWNACRKVGGTSNFYTAYSTKDK